MKLIVRFWNGNKRGPIGSYPLREKQIEAQQAQGLRYKGDMIANPEGSRVNWDRYLGHNIACIAVDGNGEIIDFDFNHNDFFRSSAEHAESRMVRRLFSLADIRDSWKTGQQIGNKSRAFSLNDVTLYTSLESCAQCSGVMSLGGVKQIIYLAERLHCVHDRQHHVQSGQSNGQTSGRAGADSRDRDRPRTVHTT
jgi:tRNA(Arg) A34 adenosine deaminase TadA